MLIIYLLIENSLCFFFIIIIIILLIILFNTLVGSPSYKFSSYQNAFFYYTNTIVNIYNRSIILLSFILLILLIPIITHFIIESTSNFNTVLFTSVFIVLSFGLIILILVYFCYKRFLKKLSINPPWGYILVKMEKKIQQKSKTLPFLHNLRFIVGRLNLFAIFLFDGP